MEYLCIHDFHGDHQADPSSLGLQFGRCYFHLFRLKPACSVQTVLVKLMPRWQLHHWVALAMQVLHAQTALLVKLMRPRLPHAGLLSPSALGFRTYKRRKLAGLRVTQNRVIRANRACEGKSSGERGRQKTLEGDFDIQHYLSKPSFF